MNTPATLRFAVSLPPGATNTLPSGNILLGKRAQLIESDPSGFPPAHPRQKPIEEWNGSVCVRIYKTKWRDKKRRKTYRSHMLIWHDAGRRFREKRSNIETARKRAQDIAGAIANGQTARLQFSQADIASLLRARELLKKAGSPPIEVVAGIYAEAFEILAGVPVLDAIRYYRAQNPAGTLRKTVSEIITELFIKRKMGAKWKRILETMLHRFGQRFSGPLLELRGPDIEDWLDKLTDRRGKPVGLQTRRNYREAILSIISFARERGYCGKDWNPLQNVSDPDPGKIKINIYTPEELAAMLAVAERHPAYKKDVPFIVTTAFAGVRHGEMNEEKIRLLDWSDFDFEEKEIWIDGDASKTGQDRIAQMSDNLIQWLEPYRQESGRLCTRKNTGDMLCRLRALAVREVLRDADSCANTEHATRLRGIAKGLGEPKKNALRKSYVTYEAARSGVQVAADNAGHSQAISRRHYRKVRKQLKKLSDRWFTLKPQRADIVTPLFAWRAQA